MTRVFRAADNQNGLNGGPFIHGVIEGTGPAAYTHSGLLLPDEAGIYQSIAANDPPVYYHSGKWWLYAAPELENLAPNSNDATTGAWNGPATTTFDQIGLTGAPNTASLISDTDAGSQQSIATGAITIPADTNPSTVRFMLLKETTGSVYSELRVNFGGSPNVRFDVETGDLLVRSGTADGTDVRDMGWFWDVLIQTTNTGAQTSVNGQIYPTIATSAGGSGDSTLTGSRTLLNIEVYNNKTIANIRGSAPIITAGAPVTNVAAETVWPDANSPVGDTNGVLYTEFVPFSEAGELFTSVMGIWGGGGGTDQWIDVNTWGPRIATRYTNTSDVSTLLQTVSGSWELGSTAKGGSAFHDAAGDIVVKSQGLTSQEQSATDFKSAGQAFMTGVQTNRSTALVDRVLLLRNIRFYDTFADFAEAEQQLDNLLAGIEDSDLGVKSYQVNDQWRAFLTAQGFTTGNYNTDMFAYLGSKGYEGALPDRLAQWWAAGAPV